MFSGCGTRGTSTTGGTSALTVDHDATPATQALFLNLLDIQQQGKTLFGHQDALRYGFLWDGYSGRSDVKDVTGSHPAVLGLDFGHVTWPDKAEARKINNDFVRIVKDFYAQGGVVTFCWHMNNPVTGGSFYWDETPVEAVSAILPGGTHHEVYKSYLKAAADLNSRFVDAKGEAIPIIFRPFHEFEGEWFWWGATHRTREELFDLWRFTVEYLRDELKVHNFLYAFTSDCRFDTAEEFMECYPGDEWVDIVGFDDYWDFRPDGNNDPSLVLKKLQIVSDIAKQRGKVAALTETGLEEIKQDRWFSQTLLPILKQTDIAYIMCWRNAFGSEHHYYVPYKGHSQEADFVQFFNDDAMLFLNDSPDMYTR